MLNDTTIISKCLKFEKKDHWEARSQGNTLPEAFFLLISATNSDTSTVFFEHFLCSLYLNGYIETKMKIPILRESRFIS